MFLVVDATGFEPAASASRTQRSTKLSHASNVAVFLATKKIVHHFGGAVNNFFKKIGGEANDGLQFSFPSFSQKPHKSGFVADVRRGREASVQLQTLKIKRCGWLSPWRGSFRSATNTRNQELRLIFAAAGKLPFSHKHSKSGIVADVRRNKEEWQKNRARNCNKWRRRRLVSAATFSHSFFRPEGLPISLKFLFDS